MKKASKQKRLLAFVADFLIVAIIQTLLMFVFIAMPVMIHEIDTNSAIVYNLFITILSFLIIVLRDVFGGQSIGKRILKIIVKSTDDETISVFRLLVRNFTFIIWPIEIFYFIYSKGSIRLGDRLARTLVFEI